ncbi:hypothetical protein AURDEDRAFT_144451 [Auricularia subglabra TFB-10046 SS5]|nr:hypothetical protein AURDEDRAFT_144451 [Auricularia subglabra TFB-10046 SS5]
MLSGTARYSATAVQCLNNQFLSLSDNAAVEALLQDIPFFAIGLLGFGVATIMFVCRRMVRPGIFIVISIVLAFVAATLDLFRILYEINSADDARLGALFIAREVCISLGQGARFLFFWDYASRSPVPSKSRWSARRMLLEGAIIGGSVGIAVLQTIWRLAPTGVKQGPVYLADTITELVLGAILGLKIVRYFFLSPPTTYIRRSIPLVGGLAIAMGITVGNLFIYDFEDTMLGRFLQAIELYIVVLVVLVASMDSPSVEQLPAGGASNETLQTRRSSFIGLAIRNSLSPFRAAPAPGNNAGSSTESSGARRPSLSRLPTIDRLSQWITTRMSQRTIDPQASVRLWERPDEKDLEQASAQVVTVDEKSAYAMETAGLDASPGLGGDREQKVLATWRDPVYTAVANGVITPTTAQTAQFSPPARPDSYAIMPSTPASGTIKAARRASIATSVIIVPSPSPPRRSSSTSLRYERPRSTTDSPVFGLEGIIRNLGLKPPTPRASAAVAPKSPPQASPPPSAGMSALESSMARLESFFPEEKRRSLRQRPTTMTTVKSDSNDSNVSLDFSVQPSSYKSDLSLSSFPAPPTSGLVVDDVPFDLVPPPAFGSRVLSGYPETTSSTGSLIADYYTGAMSEGRPSVEAFARGRATQLDVTSFIGDLTTPRPPGSEPGTPLSAILLDIGRSLERPQPSPLGRVSPTSPQTTPRPANPPAAMTRGPAPLRVGTAAANVAPVPPESPIVKLPEPAVVSPLSIRGKGLTSPIVARVTPAAPRMSPVVDSAPAPVPARVRDELRSPSSREDLRSTPSLRRPAGGAVRTLPISGPISRTSVTVAKSDAFERPRAAPAPGN